MMLAEFQAAMEQRGKLDCKFRCPICGNEASPADFQAADLDPQLAPQECIGRYLEDVGCDFAAYGLVPGPVEVQTPAGETIYVFEFA